MINWNASLWKITLLCNTVATSGQHITCSWLRQHVIMLPFSHCFWCNKEFIDGQYGGIGNVFHLWSFRIEFSNQVLQARTLPAVQVCRLLQQFAIEDLQTSRIPPNCLSLGSLQTRKEWRNKSWHADVERKTQYAVRASALCCSEVRLVFRRHTFWLTKQLFFFFPSLYEPEVAKLEGFSCDLFVSLHCVALSLLRAVVSGDLRKNLYREFRVCTWHPKFSN